MKLSFNQFNQITLIMTKNLFWILLSGLFCACSEQNVGNEYFLKGQEVKFDSANENLWPYLKVGDAVFGSTNDGSLQIGVGKLTKDEWQKAEMLSQTELEHGQKSQGPNGELWVLTQANIESRLLEGKLGSLIKIPNADNVANIKDQTKWERYDLRQVQGIIPSRDYVALSDSTFLLAGQVSNDIKHVFSIIDYKNQKLIPLDYWPEGGAPNDTTKFSHYVPNCTILGNGKGKMLYMNPWAKLAFIFNVDGKKVNILNDLYSYTFTPERPTERLSCCANSDRIYMLIRNSNIKGGKELNEFGDLYGNTVEVYDWDGVKQQVIHLDNYYKGIMLSGDGNTLFLLPDMTCDIIKPAIYSYDISNLGDNPMIDSLEMAKICKANAEKTLEKYGKKDVLKEGDMMVDFELFDYNDKPHHLNEFLGKGKYTILEFSDMYCGACRMAAPHLEKFYKQNKDKVEIITVSDDKLSDWKKKPNGEVSWHEWNDHNLAREIRKKYDVLGNPTFFVINPEGKIVKKYIGFSEQVFDEMKDIVSGKK